MSHLGTGGTERQCLEVLARMHGDANELQMDVHLATFCGPPFHHVLPAPAGVVWHQLDRPWTPRGALAAARALRKVAADYDVVHGLLWPGIWVCALARTRAPLVASIHNTVQPAGHLGFKRRLDRVFLRRACHLVFNSEAGRTALGGPLGFAGRETTVIPNGKEPYPGPWPRRGGVVCVARLVHQKRIDLLLAALETRRDPVPGGVRFIGQGTDSAKFRGQLRALGRNDVQGLGEVTDPMTHIASADVLVLPTDHEGMPNVILEAWNARTVVLASRVPGVAELVRDGVDGRLVENTPDAWAAALDHALGDPDSTRPLAERGRERLENEFSLACAAERWAGVYRRAASPSP